MNILTIAISLIACLVVWGVIAIVAVFIVNMRSSQISQQEEIQK